MKRLLLLLAFFPAVLLADDQIDFAAIHAQGLAIYTSEDTPDFRDAYSFFHQAASAGYAPSQYYLGLLYGQGRGIDQDYSNSLHWLRKAADNGHGQAYYQIGRYYQHGYGVNPSHYRASLWYSYSIDHGYFESADSLQRLYQSNQSLRTNTGDLLLKNAEDGDLNSQYNLAYAYYIGNQRVQNLSKAAEWFLKAAVRGDLDSQTMLAKMYARGEGVNKSSERCYKWGKLVDSDEPEFREILASCRAELNDEQLGILDSQVANMEKFLAAL